MSAVIFFPKFGREPEHLPLIPAMPSLVSLVVTLQRNYVAQLTWRELINLHRAAWHVAKGEDADEVLQVFYLKQVHKIYLRVTSQNPEAA